MKNPLPLRIAAPFLALAGGALGGLVFRLALGSGLYALVLVGLGAGLGGGLLLHGKDRLNGALCALLALVGAYLLHWYLVGTDDHGLDRLVASFADLGILVHLSAWLGAVVAYSEGTGLRRGRRAPQEAAPSSEEGR